MKNVIPLLISGIFIIGAVGCGEKAAKTGSENPTTTNEVLQPSTREVSETESLNQPLNKTEEETAAKNPTATNSTENLLENDLSKEVSKILKENLPTSNLEVKEQQGVITVSGTVMSQEELEEIEPLTKGVTGVEGVNVEANVEDVNSSEDMNSTNETIAE